MGNRRSGRLIMATFNDLLSAVDVTTDDHRQQAKESLVFNQGRNEAWKYFTMDEFSPTDISQGVKEPFAENLVLGREVNPFSFANTILTPSVTSISLTHNETLTLSLSKDDHQRFHIVASEGVAATVILDLRLVSLDYLNLFASFEIGKKAQVSVVVISDKIGTYTDHFDVSQAAESEFSFISFDRNPEKIKRHIFHEFTGEDADASYSGVSLLSGKSKQSTQLWINHFAKDCRSHQLFKTILDDQSLSEFSGLVTVKEGCHLTDSQQLNQNLLLSDHARVLSRPQLVIDADDVQCAHGCTIGQLNPDEVFYIQSRGLSEQESKALLTFGFVEEVVEKISDDELRGNLESLIKEEIKNYV